MKCKDCDHCLWEEGDYEHCPPGWGIYYCELTNKGIKEHTYFNGERDELCPLPIQLDLF